VSVSVPYGTPSWVVSMSTGDTGVPTWVRLLLDSGRGTKRQNEFSLEICQRLGLPGTAGSDSHELADVGACATEFDAPIADAAGLIAELRAGRFRPVVLRG